MARAQPSPVDVEGVIDSISPEYFAFMGMEMNDILKAALNVITIGGDTVIDNPDVEKMLGGAAAATLVGAVVAGGYAVYKILNDSDAAENVSTAYRGKKEDR